MVYSVSDYKIEIGTPVETGEPQLSTVSNVESMEMKLKGTTKAWNPMELRGWARNMVTGKTLSLTFKGKRCYGDAGNDFVANKLLSIGSDCAAVLKITFPNGDALSCDGLVDITSSFGGASTDMDSMEWTYTVDGKPEYLEAAHA